MATIGRFQLGDETFYAKVIEGEIYRVRGDVFGSPTFDKKATPHKGVRTLTPVAPSKIIAVGLNYADHAREQNKPLPKEPLIWLKAPTSLIPDGGKIEGPFPNHRTDFEAELCIVIGRRIRNVTPAAASRYIFGYTAALDISDRNIQNSETQYARAKSFDTFTPLGPYVETKTNPHDLAILEELDGQVLRIGLCLHIRSQRGEGVKGLGARILGFAVLDVAVADVQGGGIAEDVARRGGGRHVANAPANDDAQLGFKVRPVVRKRHLDLAAIRDQRGGR